MNRQTFTRLFFVLSLVSSNCLAQSVAGFWLGVTYPTDPQQDVYNYTMTLTQTGRAIGGTAQTANPDVPFGGVAYLSGQFVNPTLSFREADVNGRTDTPDICYWKGDLTYDPVAESLTGAYENIPNSNNSMCARTPGGKVELYRIVLKSGTKYCKGSPIDLVVTGKNIRWYTSDKKTNLLATGNQFSPKIDRTTTFYITQTLYKNESPAVPITIEVVEPTFRATTTPAGCGQTNGSISLIGSADYQYSLNGGAFQTTPRFANLSPGTYTVAAKDPTGCRAEQSITFSTSAGPTIGDLKTTPPRCGTANGEVTVTANGGTAPLTYSLDGTNFQTNAQFRNLSAGAFTVRVRDAGGCEATRAVTLPPSRALVFVRTDAYATTCGQPNGRAALTVSGGTQPIQYRVDGQPFQATPTFGDLPSGDYTLTAQDSAGCQLNQSVRIASSTGPRITNVRATPADCDQRNGTLALVPDSSAGQTQFSLDGQTFQRSSLYSSLPAGNYTLTAKDNQGCVVTRVVSILLNCSNLIHLPTAFSPNADRQNDALTAHFQFPSITVTRFTVYDRWGSVIHNRANFVLADGEPLWDGQVAGRPAPTGTYAYQFDCQFPDGTQTTYRRSVMLLTN